MPNEVITENEQNKITERDRYYMSLAEITSSRSKDPRTKVGACLVKNKKVLSLGYNGAPRRIPDSKVPYDSRDTSLPLKEQKYGYIVHSEINSILNYSGSLSDLEGATIYVTVFPCCDCAKALIQVGISKIYYLSEYTGNQESCDMSKYLFDLAGVLYIKMGN